MEELNHHMIATVNMVAKNLTNGELNALYLSSMLGTDPTGVIGYDKAKSLYTEHDGKKMHQITRETFEAICNQRLFGQ